ncbi:MAG: diphthine synthase [Nitrosopumilaceae archaeon]|jgi:diphthine synthase|uniref:Diphthine synthase n=2 Tax=Candidatus Nitrosomaritimum aestuariumsis TaxID=3342354 RepID=A0AC60W9T2_9ARCH|nr:diphthine synthase [Nitrosopumilaceae archaeon]MBA4460503.1 diphthine synthase [Nitrosopumilaceae archaeon]MBA4460918.1 diphthine synthase [Nitrosopumilaceae archaeon]MBA4464175.1 diphthine synthase [Nitrosopumilaceae archaeon]NCF22372.1 diphthine synthase [Nitrosopumilaceae archaeon]
MLWFVGLGISGAKSIPLEAQEVLAKADIIYLEQFTSPIGKSDLSKIKKMTKGDFRPAKRWLVEDGNEILKNAKRNKVVLLSYGDPYIATTHIELRTRAIEEKIKTKSIHASSSLTSMIGECGLHFYKVGRIATIMSEMKSLTTPYYVIYKNIIEGNHTVLLLEYNQDKDFFLDPKDALMGLVETEKGQKRNVIDSSTYAVVASRIGFANQSIISGKISSLKKMDFGKPPHTVIITGRLHFTESDALKILGDCLDEPTDNSEKTEKISIQMMKKYVPMVREALEEIEPHYKGQKEYQIILENAELYIRDAEKFLEDGQDEVAILSIGYADGLVDALRLAKGFDPKM